MSGVQRSVQRLVNARLVKLQAPDWVQQTVGGALWDDPTSDWQEWLVCLQPGVSVWCETTADILAVRAGRSTAFWVVNILMPLNDELGEQLEQFRLFPTRWAQAHPAHIEARR